MSSNVYTYVELQEEQEASFFVTITEEMMQSFLSITQDTNPLHTDAAFARSVGFDEKAVYGMLTASFLSTLAGVYLPGKYSLIHKIDMEFPNAVHIGDKLKVNGKIIAKDDRFKTITVKTSIINDKGQKVCRGKMQIGVLA